MSITSVLVIIGISIVLVASIVFAIESKISNRLLDNAGEGIVESELEDESRDEAIKDINNHTKEIKETVKKEKVNVSKRREKVNKRREKQIERKKELKAKKEAKLRKKKWRKSF